MKIERPNQVWAMDITYIPMVKEFVYLAAAVDRFTSIAFTSVLAEARASIGRYLKWYNGGRPHSSLDRRTPDEADLNHTPLLKAA